MNPVLLVASREFTERLRSKAFLFSNVLIIVVLLGATLAPALFGGDDGPTRLGVVDEESARVAAIAQGQQAVSGVEIEASEFAGVEEAEAALLDDELDAVLIGGNRVLVEQGLDQSVQGALSGALQGLALDDALAEAGLEPAERSTLLTPPPLQVEQLGDPAAEPFTPVLLVAFAAVMVLYGFLVLYGQWVAQGIVEEKSSRVIEVLLSTIRPTQLLGGKVLGIGALGLMQILLISAVGAAAMLTIQNVDIPPGAYAVLGWVVAWYVLGYAIYAMLFAVTGSLVARVEDLQSAATPVFLVIFAALFAVQMTLGAPDSTLAQVTGLIPFTAPLVQPLRVAAGVAPPWEVATAVGLTVVTILLLVPLAARFYTGGVLRTRTKISLKDAWSGADRPKEKAGA